MTARAPNRLRGGIPSGFFERGWMPLSIAGLFILPSKLFADAGTPLLWAGIAHLVIGNCFIGVLEGFLLAKFFILNLKKTVPVLILANYFSAWVGALFLEKLIVPSLPMDLDNGWRWFWVMVFLTWLMTLFLEWPFVAYCFRGSLNWLARSIKGNLLIQSASYILLFGWYWSASGTSLYTTMHVVSADKVSLPKSVLVYFISTGDGNVYVRNLDGGAVRRVFEMKSDSREDRLLVHPSSVQTNSWELMAYLENPPPRGANRMQADYRHPNLIEIKRGFAYQAVTDSRSWQDPQGLVDT